MSKKATKTVQLAETALATEVATVPEVKAQIDYKQIFEAFNSHLLNRAINKITDFSLAVPIETSKYETLFEFLNVNGYGLSKFGSDKKIQTLLPKGEIILNDGIIYNFYKRVSAEKIAVITDKKVGFIQYIGNLFRYFPEDKIEGKQLSKSLLYEIIKVDSAKISEDKVAE